MPAVMHYNDPEQFTVNHAFFSLKKTFQKGAEQLPDPHHQDRALEFARLAEQTFWLERAADFHQRAFETGKASFIRKGTAYIAKAGEAGNMGETDRARLLGQYMAGQVKKDAFVSSLESTWDSDLKPLLSRQAAVHKGP